MVLFAVFIGVARKLKLTEKEKEKEKNEEDEPTAAIRARQNRAKPTKPQNGGRQENTSQMDAEIGPCHPGTCCWEEREWKDSKEMRKKRRKKKNQGETKDVCKIQSHAQHATEYKEDILHRRLEA